MPIDTNVKSVMRTTSELPLIEGWPDQLDILSEASSTWMQPSSFFSVPRFPAELWQMAQFFSSSFGGSSSIRCGMSGGRRASRSGPLSGRFGDCIVSVWNFSVIAAAASIRDPGVVPPKLVWYLGEEEGGRRGRFA